MGRLTQREKSRQLDSLSDDLVFDPNYVFISKYTQWADGVAPDTDYSYDAMQRVRDEMIVGKKISSVDVRRMIRRVDWMSDTVYDEYQSDDPYLEDKDFYVLTGSRHVFKCISNAGGTESTVEPSLTILSNFSTADGYVWRYMFTIPPDELDKFSDSELFPFSSNTSVENAAVSGTVDAIRIDESGNNWIVYETGSIASVVSNNVFQISSNAVPSSGYYACSSIYVMSGVGAGYLSEIASYEANASGNFVTTYVESANVSFGDVYLLSPTIKVTGDGQGAKAYSTVNTSSSTIHGVTVIDPGNSYTWAEVTAYSAAGASNSSVAMTAMISPRGGHGADPKFELFSKDLRVSVDFDANAAPLVSYRVAGFLRTPKNASNANYTNTTFRAYVEADSAYVIGVTSPPSPGETVIGVTSAASGTVISANSSSIEIGDVDGSFVEGENVASAGPSGSVVTLTGINTPQVNADSGTIVFYEYFEPVSRSNTTSERVRLTIKN